MPKGIYKRKPIIKKGDKFGRLTAVKFVDRDKMGRPFWIFRCNCGTKKRINVDHVRRKATKSCGCINIELTLKRCLTHGMTNTRTHKSWTSMKTRCLNKNNKDYKDYGSRGIMICNRWLGKNGFKNFLNDMGERPEEKTLDRKDNNKGYYKENCRWCFPKEQSNNTRKNRLIIYNGKTKTIAEWSDKLGIKYSTLYVRISNGWTIKRAIET